MQKLKASQNLEEMVGWIFLFLSFIMHVIGKTQEHSLTYQKFQGLQKRIEQIDFR